MEGTYLIEAFAAFVVLAAIIIQVAKTESLYNNIEDGFVFEKYPLKKVADCTENEPCVIVGNVSPIDSLQTAILSSRPCIGYRVCVKRFERHSGAHGGSWHKALDHKKFDNFILYDGEHYVYVPVREGKLITKFDKKYNLGSFRRLPQHVMSFLQELYPIKVSFFDSPRLEVAESILKEQERVAICGRGEWVEIDEYPSLSLLREKGVTKIFAMKNSKRDPIIIASDKRILRFVESG